MNISKKFHTINNPLCTIIFVLKYCSVNLFRAAIYKLLAVLHEDVLFHYCTLSCQHSSLINRSISDGKKTFYAIFTSSLKRFAESRRRPSNFSPTFARRRKTVGPLRASAAATTRSAESRMKLFGAVI